MPVSNYNSWIHQLGQQVPESEPMLITENLKPQMPHFNNKQKSSACLVRHLSKITAQLACPGSFNSNCSQSPFNHHKGNHSLTATANSCSSLCISVNIKSIFCITICCIQFEKVLMVSSGCISNVFTTPLFQRLQILFFFLSLWMLSKWTGRVISNK